MPVARPDMQMETVSPLKSGCRRSRRWYVVEMSTRSSVNGAPEGFNFDNAILQGF